MIESEIESFFFVSYQIMFQKSTFSAKYAPQCILKLDRFYYNLCTSNKQRSKYLEVYSEI